MYLTVVTVDDATPPNVGWTILTADDMAHDQGVLFGVPCEMFQIKAFDTEAEADAWGESIAAQLADFEIPDTLG